MIDLILSRNNVFIWNAEGNNFIIIFKIEVYKCN